MIQIIDCGALEFSRIAAVKKVYCFGAGRQLRAFMDNYWDISVAGVIDNYCWTDMDHMAVGDKKIKVISVEQFVQEHDERCVVVITCSSYDEIINQLDQIDELDGTDCYLDLFLKHYTEHFTEYPVPERKEDVIPRKIHYCWFGGGELPEKYRNYIESWKKYCPDYEIIRWDESNYDVSKNRYMKQAYNHGKWAFVSDYARVDIIYQYGGIYLDTDVELIASYDEFLKWDMFCGFEDTRVVNWGLGFGAVKGHEMLRALLDIYETRDFVRKDGAMDLTGCPVLQTFMMERYGFKMNGRPQKLGNIVVYPKEFFAPFNHIAGFGRITENTHSIHHYEGSWIDAIAKRGLHKWEPLIRKVKNRGKEKSEDRCCAVKNKTSRIKRFQIWECASASEIAGSKAPMDICTIAGNAGYQVIEIHPIKGTEGTDTYKWSKRQNDIDWDRCYSSIPPGSMLLLQHPFWQDQEKREPILERLKNEKQVSIISLVHDVEQLRKVYNQPYMRREFNFMLQMADVLIVHNEAMEEFFLNMGIKRENIIRLGLFDYISSSSPGAKELDVSIIIAGNMDPQKSKYIYKLSQLTNVKIHLFGPGYSKKDMYHCSQSHAPCAYIEYHGTYPSELLIEHLEGAFGLVWDGDSLDTCSGETGDYLRFNNPHKLSLYLAAGIPVILWQKAAKAAWVEENRAGILVDSLYEIPDRLQKMTREEYGRYAAAAAVLSEGIRNGAHTRAALQAAEKQLGIEEV